MTDQWQPPMTPAQYAAFSARPLETHPDRQCKACDGFGFFGPWDDNPDGLLRVAKCDLCDGTGHPTDWPSVKDALALLGVLCALAVLAAFWVVTP